MNAPFTISPLHCGRLRQAALTERQHVALFSYRSPTGHTIGDAVNFLGSALADPGMIKAYTPDEQLIDDVGRGLLQLRRVLLQLAECRNSPPAILKGLERPTYASRIGGSTTVIDGYTPHAKK